MPIDSEKIRLTFEITNQAQLDKLFKNVHTVNVTLKSSSTGDLKKLENLRDKGITINTRFQLYGQDFNLLQKWATQGIVIKTKFEGLPSPSDINKMYGGSGSTGRSSTPAPASSSGLILPASYKSAMEAEDKKILTLKKGQGEGLANFIAAQKRVNTALEGFAKSIEKQSIPLAKSIGSFTPSTGNFLDQVKKEYYSSDRDSARRSPINRAGSFYNYMSPSVGAYPGNTPEQKALASQELEIFKVKQQQLLEEQERLKNQRISNASFRQQQRFQKALKQVQLSPKFYDFDEEIDKAAYDNNVNPQDLRDSLGRKAVKGSLQARFGGKPSSKPVDNRKIFDFKRINLKEPEVARDLAFAALFGGPSALLGGISGGGLAGRAGISVGAVVGQVLIDKAVQVIELLAEGMKHAAEAGLRFNESILGISATLQATSRVVGSNGQELSFRDSIKFQQGQARNIQLAARSKLLPIGIAGEREATLVQAIVSGAAQKGIQLTPEQAATLAERIGGAIQAQRPELLNNPAQLRRDVEDLLSGLPNRTVLGSLIKGFAPGLGKATSGEEYIRASSGLAQFPAVLAGSKNSPVVAFAQLNSAIDNLNTTVGDKLITSLIPGINALSSALRDPGLTAGLVNFANLIGTIASALALFSSPKNVTKEDSKEVIAKEAARRSIIQTIAHSALIGPLGTVASLTDLAGSAVQGIGDFFSPKEKPLEAHAETRSETSLGNLLRKLGTNNEAINLEEIGGGKGSTLAKKLNVNLISGILTGVEKERIEEFNKIKDSDLLKTPEIQEEIKKGTSKESALQKFKKRNIDAIKDGIFGQRIGASVLKQQVAEERGQELLGLIDQSTLAGKLSAISFQQNRIPDSKIEIDNEIFLRKQQVGTLRDRIKEASSDKNTPKEAIKALTVEFNNALGALESAEGKLISKRKLEVSLIQQTGDAIQARITKEKGQFNPGTFSGQESIIGLEKKSIGSEGATLKQSRDKILEQLKSATRPDEIKDLQKQLSEYNLNQRILNNRRSITGEAGERLEIDRNQAIYGYNRINRDESLDRAQFGLSGRSLDLRGRGLGLQGRNLDLQGSELDLRGRSLANNDKSLILQGKELDLAVSDLPRKLEELGISATQAARSFDDFTKEAGNRALGRQGQLLSAVDAARAKGASESDITGLLRGTELNSLDTEGIFRGDLEKKIALSQLETLSQHFQKSRIDQEEGEEGTKFRFSKERAKEEANKRPEILKGELEIRREGLEIAKVQSTIDKERLLIDKDQLSLAKEQIGIDKEQLEIDKQRLTNSEADRQFSRDAQLAELGFKFREDKSKTGQTITSAGKDAADRIADTITNGLGFKNLSSKGGKPVLGGNATVSPGTTLPTDLASNYPLSSTQFPLSGIQASAEGIPEKPFGPSSFYANPEEESKSKSFFSINGQEISSKANGSMFTFDGAPVQPEDKGSSFTIGGGLFDKEGKLSSMGFDTGIGPAVVLPGSELPFGLSTFDGKKGDIYQEGFNPKYTSPYAPAGYYQRNGIEGLDEKDPMVHANKFDSDFASTANSAVARLKPGFASNAVAAAAGEDNKKVVENGSKLIEGIKELIKTTVEQTSKLPQAVRSGLESSFGN